MGQARGVTFKSEVFPEFVDDLEPHRGFRASILVTKSVRDRQVAACGRPRTAFASGFPRLSPPSITITGCVHRRERAVGIFGKSRVAGRVHKVKTVVSLPCITKSNDMRDGRGQEMPRSFFHRINRTRGGRASPLAAPVRHWDRPTEQQESLSAWFSPSGVGGSQRCDAEAISAGKAGRFEGVSTWMAYITPEHTRRLAWSQVGGISLGPARENLMGTMRRVRSRKGRRRDELKEIIARTLFAVKGAAQRHEGRTLIGLYAADAVSVEAMDHGKRA